MGQTISKWIEIWNGRPNTRRVEQKNFQVLPISQHDRLGPRKSGQRSENSVPGLHTKLPKAHSWAWRLKMSLSKIGELSNIVIFDV